MFSKKLKNENDPITTEAYRFVKITERILNKPLFEMRSQDMTSFSNDKPEKQTEKVRKYSRRINRFTTHVWGFIVNNPKEAERQFEICLKAIEILIEKRNFNAAHIIYAALCSQSLSSWVKEKEEKTVKETSKQQKEEKTWLTKTWLTKGLKKYDSLFSPLKKFEKLRKKEKIEECYIQEKGNIPSVILFSGLSVPIMQAIDNTKMAIEQCEEEIAKNEKLKNKLNEKLKNKFSEILELANGTEYKGKLGKLLEFLEEQCKNTEEISANKLIKDKLEKIITKAKGNNGQELLKDLEQVREEIDEEMREEIDEETKKLRKALESLQSFLEKDEQKKLLNVNVGLIYSNIKNYEKNVVRSAFNKEDKKFYHKFINYNVKQIKEIINNPAQGKMNISIKNKKG